MKKHEISRYLPLQVQVCSEGNINEALEWVRNEYPAGTENNWQIDDDPQVAPVECAEHPGRTHYLFCC